MAEKPKFHIVMSPEVALRLRVAAAYAGIGISELVEDLLERHLPELPGVPNAMSGKEKKAKVPRMEPRQMELLAPVGEPGASWTKERLGDALNGSGRGTQARLAQHLGISSAAVRSWLQTQVPSERWAELDDFFRAQ